MKGGILGSGDVGQALSRGFASHGHDVKIGSRTPHSDKLKAWLGQVTGKASTGTFAETRVQSRPRLRKLTLGRTYAGITINKELHLFGV
ncbi:MAG: NAD(P)-binding domain-containing protein [Candidatus Bathyarchaeia archaeon]